MDAVVAEALALAEAVVALRSPSTPGNPTLLAASAGGGDLS
jgi:hypothetical protein